MKGRITTLAVAVIAFACMTPCAAFAGTANIGTFHEGTNTYEKVVTYDESIEKDKGVSGINDIPGEKSKKTTKKTFKVNGKSYTAKLVKTVPAYVGTEQSSAICDAEKHTETSTFKRNTKHKVQYQAPDMKIREYHITKKETDTKTKAVSNDSEKPCSENVLKKIKKNSRYTTKPTVFVRVAKNTVTVNYIIKAVNEVTEKNISDGSAVTSKETTEKTKTLKVTYKKNR